MGKPQAPCKGCDERNERCHSICEKYLQYQADSKAYTKAKNDATAKDRIVSGFRRNNVDRAMKSRGVKRGEL